MNKVPRFEYGCISAQRGMDVYSIIESEDGDFVTYADYAALEQRLAAAEAQLPKWFRVDEQLPEPRRAIYMVAVFNDQSTDQYAGRRVAKTWEGWPHKFRPTHWAYAIESPKAGL